MVFAFLLCCHLLVGEEKLGKKSLGQLVVFLRFSSEVPSKNGGPSVEDEDDGVNNGDTVEGRKNEQHQSDNDNNSKKAVKKKPENLRWLGDSSWSYFIQFEEEFEELQGKYNKSYRQNIKAY